MKTSVKIVASVLVLSLFALFIASCGISDKDIIGTWTGEYEYNGNTFNVAIVFESSGKYARVTYKNGAISSTESGEYEIHGSEVIMYDSSALVYHGVSSSLKYKSGKLASSTYTLTKS